MSESNGFATCLEVLSAGVPQPIAGTEKLHPCHWGGKLEHFDPILPPKHPGGEKPHILQLWGVSSNKSISCAI